MTVFLPGPMSPRSRLPSSAAGPAFVRLLARVVGQARLPAGQPLVERLGQWIDWKQALALAAALDGPLPAATAPSSAQADDLVLTCAQERRRLAEAIAAAPELADDAEAGRDGDYARFGQRHAALQQAMLVACGRLRGQLRDRLAADPDPERARLAELDAVFERVLGPREYALLAALPGVLEQHFLQLQALVRPEAGDLFTGDAADAWLGRFRQDMRAVLQGELALRFHPLDALLAALDSR